MTIQSLTHVQPLAPSLFVTHDAEFSLFEVGPVDLMDEEQYLGLAQQAETGSPERLFDAVAIADGVDDVEMLAYTHTGSEHWYKCEDD